MLDIVLTFYYYFLDFLDKIDNYRGGKYALGDVHFTG